MFAAMYGALAQPTVILSKSICKSIFTQDICWYNHAAPHLWHLYIVAFL